MVCIICYTIYNPGYISDAQFHRYKKQLQLQFHFKTRYTYIPTHTYHTHTCIRLRVTFEFTRSHTLLFYLNTCYTKRWYWYEYEYDMTPIDPRFLPLLIRVTIWYDTIRYIRVSSICNPSVFFPLLYNTIRVPTSLYYYSVILNSSQSSILLHTYIHTHTRHWYDWWRD